MLPKEVKELLFLRGWSQFDLADALGISRVTVARWLLSPDSPHHRNMNPDHVTKMRSWLIQARRDYAKQLAKMPQ